TCWSAVKAPYPRRSLCVEGGAAFRKFLGASCNRSPFQTIQEARSVVGQFGCEVQISPAKFQDLRHLSSGEDRVRELQQTLDLSRLQHSKKPSWEAFLQGSGGCQLGWCERPSSLREDQAERGRAIQATLVCYCPPGACFTISGELLLDGASCDPPPGHSVCLNGRRFAVLPWKAAGDSDMGMDMVKDFDDNWLDIPAGWKPYEVCQDFEQVVLPQVIAANSWGTDMVIVRRGNKWPGWKTGVRGSAAGAGKRLSSHVEWFETDHAGRRCVFRAEDPQRTPSKKLDPLWRSWSGRLLLERVPDSTKIGAFKALLHLHALESCTADESTSK
ncbi:unnamed protein product, partial [Symbiodinium sp. CCMP2456]